jgi:hypothetical protein
MKRTLFTFLVICFSFEAAFAASYCEGYDQGYKSGFAEAVGVPGIDPAVPMCPPAPFSEYDNADQEYQIGYKKGHEDGFQKAEKQGNH